MGHYSEEIGETSGFMKGRKFLGHLSDFELHEKNSATLS
jgi:hypothetical protein